MKEMQKNQKASEFAIGNRRYIGGKSLLISSIRDVIPPHIPRGTFCDIFAGTGVVGASVQEDFECVVFNDFLFSNYAVYQGFFGKGQFSISKLKDFQIEMVNQISKPLKRNYFSKNYSDSYFSSSAATSIGHIRDAIERNEFKLNRREQAIALASLIYSADRIANTVGHYEAFRKNVAGFKNFEYRLIAAKTNTKSKIYRRDANELSREIKSDVVYIDPPYNSRQYSRFYHVLETLTKWDSPQLSGVALKPPTENVSEYCKSRAVTAFADLVENLDTKLVIVSYNNTYDSKSTSSQNKISIEEIKRILKSKGPTQIKKIPHKHFSAGNTDFKNHLEYLFVTEVR
jgi:adenine-specific DNA-methyltransferase